MLILSGSRGALHQGIKIKNYMPQNYMPNDNARHAGFKDELTGSIDPPSVVWVIY